MKLKGRKAKRWRRRIWREYENICGRFDNQSVWDCIVDHSHVFGWRNRHKFVCSCGKRFWFTQAGRWQTIGYTFKEVKQHG